jgi:hypothetical protein
MRVAHTTDTAAAHRCSPGPRRRHGCLRWRCRNGVMARRRAGGVDRKWLAWSAHQIPRHRVSTIGRTVAISSCMASSWDRIALSSSSTGSPGGRPVPAVDRPLSTSSRCDSGQPSAAESAVRVRGWRRRAFRLCTSSRTVVSDTCAVAASSVCVVPRSSSRSVSACDTAAQSCSTRASSPPLRTLASLAAPPISMPTLTT